MAPATASAIGGLRQGGIDRHRLAMLPEDEPIAPGVIIIFWGLIRRLGIEAEKIGGPPGSPVVRSHGRWESAVAAQGR